MMHKTVIAIVVLSEEPIDERLDVADIVRECDVGDFVLYTTTMKRQVVSDETMARLLTEAGSEPAFFNLEEVIASE